jgi:hypothetical protein
MPEFDPRGSAFISDTEDLKKTIKCPCCRQLNWKYQFNQIISITLGWDKLEGERDSPVAMLYVRNADL